jgi:hypothetical protein
MAIWSSMHCVMWFARAVSKSGKEREGSSRWQTGHSSSSRRRGIGGRGREVSMFEVEDRDAWPPKGSRRER